ncbi:MAG TPA: helix-turn-helix transcriptional regulator [Streptosporangiaceae bacterium]|nr:helix-turn-helix transcriptional regulator [Streptosporangiaceae bacterium]
MTAELGDWLAELSESQPATAGEVGAALLAVVESADPSGLVIVRQPGRAAEPVKDDPRATVDYAYQQQLEHLQHIRRRVADAASARRAAELALSAQQAAGADPAVIAALAERQAATQLHEANLARVSHRIQMDLDAFRTAKETAKARFTAAEASLRVAEAVAALGGEPDPDLAQRRADYHAAEQRLRDLRNPGVMRSVIRASSVKAEAGHPPAAGRPKPSPPQPQLPPDPAPGLLELHADPLGSDIRILFAEEPAGTLTLLAVLEGPEAVTEHGRQAITLAGDLLTEIRDEGWPADIDEVALANPAEFLARFFPDDDASIRRRAGVLAAMTSLSRLRADRRLTIDEVAAKSGLHRHRVQAIENDGLRTAHLHEAVALARVLGARLELPTGPGPVAG